MQFNLRSGAILAVLILVTAERKVDFAVFLLFYGLIVGKFALICTMEIWLFISSLDLLYLRN